MPASVRQSGVLVFAPSVWWARSRGRSAGSFPEQRLVIEPIRLTVGNKIAIGAAEICLLHQILGDRYHSRPVGAETHFSQFVTVCRWLWSIKNSVSYCFVLLLQTYFNPDILTLVRHLVTGGVSQFLEEHIAEGDELKGGLDAEQTADTRSRCKIIQMSLFDGPLSQYGVSSSFKFP